MRFRLLLALAACVCLAAPAVASAEPTFTRAHASVSILPSVLNYGYTRLEVSFIEEGLPPGESVDYSLGETYKVWYICRLPHTPPAHSESLFASGFGTSKVGTFVASDSGVVRATVGEGEGDIEGAIGEALDQGVFADCPEQRIIRTRIVYYDIFIIDSTNGVVKQIPGRVTFSRGIGP